MGTLKPPIFIPPVVALILAGAWIGAQRHSMSTLEEESAMLQKHIAAARASLAASDSAQAKPDPPAKFAKDKEPLDWKKIAGQFAEMQQGGGMGDIRSMIRFQQRLQSMIKEELVAALDEIAALDLPTDARDMLEQMLLGALIQKDPEFALSRYFDRLNDERGMMRWQLSNAMEQWAKKDPAKASAWFDQQIAAGKFDSKSLDGKSQSRQQFEAAMIQVLLESDSDAAARRLSALPADQRDDVLGHFSFRQLKEENQLAFAQLVRNQLPEQKQVAALARQAGRMVHGDGYLNVTSYLNRIEATPAERIACVEEAAESQIQALSQQKGVTAEDLDAMREWASSQAPGSADRATGKVLASSMYWGDTINFADAADLAVRYHEASNNDDVLVSFLESGGGGRENKEAARLLAAKITDEKRREEILQNLK